jgi:hypothetical protein
MHDEMATEVERGPGRIGPSRHVYSLWRVGIAGIFTLGLYYLYWFGVTWKQLNSETGGRDHYPFWHVLAQAVPIYNLFITHDHFRTIQQVQGREGVPSNIVPGWAVFIAIATAAIAAVDSAVFGNNISFLTPLGVILPVGLMVWGQSNLNAYWRHVGGGQARSARAGVGEVTLSAAGAVVLGLVLLGSMAPAGPSSLSPEQITPIAVGAEAPGHIKDGLEMDAFSFAAERGKRYVIEVQRGPGDPLEDSLLVLWGADGATVLQENDDFGGDLMSRIEWTAPSSDRYFATVENADFISTGTYMLTIREAR